MAGDREQMIVVRVELWSARTGDRTELARMEICNDETGSTSRRNYIARTLRGRSTAQLNRRESQRQASVKQWPSEAVHVWNLVATALAGMGYRDVRRSREAKAREAAAVARGNEEGFFSP
jgi:hypothetical protein